VAPFLSELLGGNVSDGGMGSQNEGSCSTLTRRFATLSRWERVAKRQVRVEVLLPFRLGLNLQFDVSGDVFEKANRNGELANRLDVIVHMDLAPLDLESLGFK